MENLTTRMLPPIWLKGEVEVADGYVVLNRNHAKEHQLAGTDANNMAFELATLALPDPTDREAFENRIRRFVRDYGLLWHGADDKASEFKEPLQAWLGESLLLGLIGSLYQKITRAVAEDIPQGSAAPVKALLNQYGIYFPHVRSEGPLFDRRYILEATSWLQDQLNNGMQGRNGVPCEWGILATGPGELILMQHPPDLLSHAYATFAVLMAIKAPLKTCPGCGRLFVPKDIRQKWHSPGCGSTWRGQKKRADDKARRAG
jgi:hypothetical protein